jgi:hypothetical protein
MRMMDLLRGKFFKAAEKEMGDKAGDGSVYAWRSPGTKDEVDDRPNQTVQVAPTTSFVPYPLSLIYPK